MLRSVFWRLVASHVLVAVLAVTLAETLSYRLFRNHYMATEQREVVRIGRAIADLATPMLVRPNALAQIHSIAETAGAILNGRVCIFERSTQELIAASAEVEGEELDTETSLYDLLGDEVRVERTSAPCEPRQQLKVIVPVNSANGPLGSVMIRAPVAGTEAVLRSLRQLSLAMGAGVAAVAFLLSLVMSRTISSPLKRISLTSLRIGSGDFAARVQPLPQGEIGGLAAAINHMAEQLEDMFGRLEREKNVLEENIAQARRLEEMQRSFIANASHQLRTPLTGARGFLEALADGTAATPAAQKRCVTVALGQLGRMQTLIERLMDLSRFDAGMVELDREPANIRELLEGAIASFEPRLNEAGLRVVIECEANLLPLNVDGSRIVEALGNLLDNAIRVSPPHATITLRAESNNGGVKFSVIDTGPGVEPEALENVWERFYSHTRPGEAPGGNGLGLAIVREIVSAHGGEVFARNRPEGGAEFGFVVPG
ncbi:MAG: sensor histidine kinase [Candidatus Zipacnadales bacterium]